MSQDQNNDSTEKKSRGRPTLYSKQICDEVCNRLAHGETLRSILADDHLPDRSQIYRWLDEYEEFRDQYAQARVKQADYYAEMIVDEAFSSNDAAIGRLRMDALKWASSKLAPKKYGDKVEVEQTGNNSVSLSFSLPSRSTIPLKIEESRQLE
jgi:hypothetical protein